MFKYLALFAAGTALYLKYLYPHLGFADIFLMILMLPPYPV